MIKVFLSKQSNYPVSAPKVKNALKNFLKKEGIVSKADVSVSLVGEKKMLFLAQKYLHEVGVLHNVLSFPFVEAKDAFVSPPDDTIHLGEIVVCFPKVTKEASAEGKLIDEKVIELVTHGALHLLGKHHE
jgi:probable rRNA maturation factor